MDIHPLDGLVRSAVGVAHLQPAFRETLAEFIEGISNRFLNEGSCTGGLTLVVMGGDVR
jgi:hypothetical protein